MGKGRSRGQEIIQSPAHVLLPCTAPVGPPGIHHRVRVLVPPHVGEACIQQRRHAVDLLLRVPWRFVVVRVGAGQIDALVRHIQISAAHDRLVFSQPLEVGPERHIPFLSERKPLQTRRTVGGVDRDEVEVVELGGGDPSFIVQLVHTDAMGHLQGFHPREDGGAAVALFDRRRTVDVPIPGQAEQGFPNLVILGLGFLKTQHVEAAASQPRFKVFLHHGAHAVDVPTAQFHGCNLAPIPRSHPIPGGRPQPLATRCASRGCRVGEVATRRRTCSISIR